MKSYLKEQEQKIRDKLIELKLLKIVFNPCEEISLEEWNENLEPYRHGKDEPVYLYFNYKDTRKNKYKFNRWMLGDWQFKMLILKTKLNLKVFEFIEKYPKMLSLFDLGESCASVHTIKRKLKKQVLLREAGDKWSELYGDKWQTQEVPDVNKFVKKYIEDKLNFLEI